MKRSLTLIGLLACAPLFASDCRQQLIEGKENVVATWSGACKDGLPDGEGVLERRVDGELRMRYEGTLERGIPHGQGYARLSDGSEYEGQFRHGKREGQGKWASPFGNLYQGAFLDNKPDGDGAIEYALGGSYQGQWKNGKPHGKGVAVFAGGRRAEGEFVDGQLAGAEERPAAPRQSYALRVRPARMGRIDSHHVVGSTVPYDKSYAEMSAEQKQAVRAAWPMLDANDEPPYPLEGTKELFTWISRAQNERVVTGELLMKVHVDREGNATSVRVLASPDEKMRDFVAALAMKQKYSPALCQGTPCAMAYPLSLRFTRGRPVRR